MGEAIITRRGASGIKARVVNTSFSSKSLYFDDTAYGTKVAYYDNGDIYVSVRRGGSHSDSEKAIEFELATAPDGVTISGKSVLSAPNGTVAGSCIYGVVLSGISSAVSIDVSVSSKYTAHATATVTVTEI